MSSAASWVSDNHSAMAAPVPMFVALPMRSKVASKSGVTGTDTLCFLGEESVLFMCCIVQHGAAHVHKVAAWVFSSNRKTEYRFSEREGWHLGTPTPRPQKTWWHSLRPQGPRRRLGVVVADGTGLHRDHPPGTRCTFSRAPGGVVRPPRPPTVPAPPVPVGGLGGPPPPRGCRSSCSV